MTLPGGHGGPGWTAGPTLLDEPVGVRAAPGPVTQVLRILIALGLLLLGVQELGRPVPSTADHLLGDLLADRVEWLELTEESDPSSGVGATQEARWSTGGLRVRVARVGQSRLDDSAQEGPGGGAPVGLGQVDLGQVDVGQVLAAAEASGTPVVRVVPEPWPSGVHTDWLALVTGTAAFAYLVAGPHPRLATRWAWWWLGLAVPAVWLALVVLEPVPLGARSAPDRDRLRGGWAFLISLVVGGILTTAGPDWSGILFTHRP